MADWTGAVRSEGPIYRTQGRIWSAKDKGWRAFQTRGVPVRDCAGKVIEWVGALTDVQDALDSQAKLQARERELRESRLAGDRLRERLRRLVDSNIIAVVTATDAGITDANDAFLRLVGRSAGELRSGSIDWRAMTPPEYARRDEAALAQLESRGEWEPYEKEYVRPDGSRVPILVGAVLLSRTPREWACFIIDISAQKKAEAALQQARRLAERASDEKTRFLASASHDLRQPLQVLTALLSMLSDRPHAPDDAALIARAERAVQVIGDLLNALMDVAQLDAGKLRPRFEDFPIARLLDALREEFEIEASQKGVALSIANDDSWTRSDPLLLGRILRNFVSNAVKFTPPGGRIEIRCRQERDRLAIRVADTGIGIALEMHRFIFEDFRQLANPERDHRKGLGLGLSIANRMAALLQHEITLESAPGSGSIFGVVVPVASPVTVKQSRPVQPVIRQRILLIDDNPEVSETLAAMLSDLGHDVVTLHSAEEAIAAVRSQAIAFDAVISDFRLPGADGIEAIGAFRRRWPAATAILLSGDSFAPELQQVSSRGIRLLTKPVTMAKLAQALGEAGAEAVHLRRKVHETLERASTCAVSGEAERAIELTERASELEMKAQATARGGSANARSRDRPGRIRQFRLRAEENRTIADAATTSAARELMLKAAESCERIAASLEATEDQKRAH